MNIKSLKLSLILAIMLSGSLSLVRADDVDTTKVGVVDGEIYCFEITTYDATGIFTGGDSGDLEISYPEGKVGDKTKYEIIDATPNSANEISVKLTNTTHTDLEEKIPLDEIGDFAVFNDWTFFENATNTGLVDGFIITEDDVTIDNGATLFTVSSEMSFIFTIAAEYSYEKSTGVTMMTTIEMSLLTDSIKIVWERTDDCSMGGGDPAIPGFQLISAIIAIGIIIPVSRKRK